MKRNATTSVDLRHTAEAVAYSSQSGVFEFLLAKLDKPLVATTLAGMCTFLNVYCTQPLLPLLRQILHASEFQVSQTVSATIVATALAAPFVGMIAERHGRKKIIVPSLFLLTFLPLWRRPLPA